ncbi:RNase H domain-containing protein [Trichonephila clavipes]|uniref:RNase H domain-containing protein n=1 Tax=Trichonephila clavipes TaxID=2585209 RepID=A0A8X6WAA9_TRICX|nr:RNase H domain-containing protein [Trichonephila clavipes]
MSLQPGGVAAVAEWYRYRTVACFVTDKAFNALESRFDLISTHSNYFQFLYNVCDLKYTPQNDELKHCKDLETVLTDGNLPGINALDLADEIVAVLALLNKKESPIEILKFRSNLDFAPSLGIVGKSFHDICRQAQLTLDFASTWTKNFKLEFNAVKSKVMFLEKRKKNALTGNLTLNGFSLDCVKELKYLGVVLDIISGYRTVSYEAVFAISGFPPIDIFIIRNNEFKIATKNCTNKCLDGSLRVSELPHPSERFPLNLVNYRKNIENNFPVVCFTDGSKINSKVGLAFVIFQDFIEIGTRQYRIRDECSVFQAELLCIAQAVSWICNNEILSSNFLICSDSLSSLCALNNIYSQNKLIVKTHINLDFLRSRGVPVFFSFVRGHTGIYGNERADWLAKKKRQN